ncbi:GWxTD domain-containing protein [candidate division KSB1 bacterium]|nr:GWxTD domain-containing protein [candidate division KSB1 bacterium]
MNQSFKSTRRQNNSSLKNCAIFCGCLFVLSCAGIIGQNREEGSRLYKKGLLFLEQGRKATALRSFRKAILKRQSFATAYYEIAKIHLTRNTISGRNKAKEALKKAILYDPGNISYRLTLANLYLKQKLTSSAESQFKTIVELDSTHAEAWYHLGHIREKEFLYYENMISADTSLAVIYFEQFAENDRKKSQQYYNKAIRYNPNLTRTYYRLGLLYYENTNFQNMVSLFKTAVQFNPNDKLSHLYLALAYHKSERLKKADSEYKIAWNLMKNQERNLYQSIEPLLANQVKKDFIKKTRTLKSQANQAYWQNRDPLFLTDYNERLLEHFSRIAYANLCFSNELKKVEGWQTDRGKVYIRYGAPLNKVKTAPRLMGRNPGSDSPRINPLLSSKETWSYPGFQFVFEDAFLNREYKFKWGMAAGNDYKEIYRKMVKTLPEYYRSPYEHRKFYVAALARQFRKEDGQTVLYIYSGILKEDIHQLLSDKRIQFEKGLFLFDSNWQPFSKSIGKTEFKNEGSSSSESNYLAAVDSVQVASGKFNYAIEYLNLSTKQIGRFKDSVLVRDFSQNTLALSDLILANNIRLQTSISEVNRNQISISPNFEHSFKPGQDLYLYYEIYNLNLDQNGLSNYTVSYEIRKLNKNPSGLSNLFVFFKKDQPDETVVVTIYNYQGNRKKENNYRILQLEDYEPGNYELHVKVEDRNNSYTNKQHISFQITSKQ